MNRFGDRAVREKNQLHFVSARKKEEQSMNKWESRKEHIARHCVDHDWEEFCRELYTALWMEADGYDNPALLCHDIYEKSGIDPVAVAYKNGFSCFEAMMHWDKLEGVVAIQKTKSLTNPNWTDIKYMAALNKDKFNDIRQKYKRRVHDITTDAILMPEEVHSEKTMKSEKWKEVTGPLISYDVTDEFLEKMLIESDGEEYNEDDDEEKEDEVKKKKMKKEKDIHPKSSEPGTSEGKVGDATKDAKPLKKPTKYADEW